jgi:hypothetical protein
VSAKREIPKLSLALAMLPEDGSGSFVACAAGAYDRYYREYGSELLRLGRGSSVVRLALRGWP